MQNEFYVVDDYLGVELKIFIATRSFTNITVNFPNNTQEKYSIPGDSVLVLNISNYFYYTVSEEVVKNAIEILTDIPVVVYSFNSQAHTSDSYVCVPVSFWGNDYAIISMPNDQYNPTYPPQSPLDSLIQYMSRPSEFCVIAGYDDTQVTMRPTSLTEAGKQVGRYYTVTLNKGDTYLVKSFPTPKGYGDLTGTLITSTKPIGVLSGHVRTAIPQVTPPGKDTKDHIVEQLQPMDSWGDLYCSVPFGVNVDGDLFRVMSREPNTKVNVYTSTIPTEYTFPDSLSTKNFTVNVPAIWQSNKPIQIAQFMQRRSVDLESKDFDPAMVLLPPREQFVERVLFTTPGGVFYNPMQYNAHYVSIISEGKAIPSLYIDGLSVDSISAISSQQIYGTDLYWTVLRLSYGTHELSSTTGRFSGFLFGVGEFDSYAMVLGASLVKPDLVDLMPPIIDVNVDCYEITGSTHDFDSEFGSGINFARVDELITNNYTWKILPSLPNDTLIQFTAQIINKNQPAVFAIECIDKEGNISTYKYEYFPFKATYSDAMDFGQMSTTDSLCMDFVIKNTGKSVQYLDSIHFPQDVRLTYYHSILVPDSLSPGEEITGRVCFNPNGNNADLNDAIIAYFACDNIVKIDMIGEVFAPAIEVTGWDFGPVYVGDSAKHEISIKNIGNIALRVDSLFFFVNDNNFSYDSLELMPVMLNPGNKFDIWVTFHPSRRDIFHASLRFANNLKINNQVNIDGKGIAPLFNDYYLDFGRRRIGTLNDTSIQIGNDGNVASEIKFKEFVIKQIDDNNSQTLENIQQIVDALDLMKLDFSFNPTDTSSYELSANLVCDWNLHPDVNVRITGTGTIPQVTTSDYDFGDVVIFSNNSASPELVESFGNEDLTIDEIKVLSGDSSSFNINYNSLKSIILPTGEKLVIPIDFIPQTLGQHKLVLGVVNDAEPNYARRTDTITITGNAIPPDVLDVSAKLIGDGDYTTCNRDTVMAVLTNNGKFPVQITKINLDFLPDNLDVKALTDFESELPITVPAESDYRIPIEVLLYVNESVTIVLTAEFNDGNERTANLTIKPITYTITILDKNDIEVMPKDTLNISFEGAIENSSQVPVSLDIKLNTNKEVLYLLPGTYYMEISSGSTIQKIPLKFVQTNDEIIFEWDADKITILKNSNWKLDLNFLVLLSTNYFTDLSLEISDNECYNGSDNSFKADVKKVCVNDARPIITVLEDVQMKIYPNPVKNILKIDLTLEKNSYFYISLFDLFGKEYNLDKNLFLSKGKYLLIYVVENMTNGNYYLQTVINGKVEYNKINIIR